MVRTSMLLQYAQIHVTIRLFDYNQVTPKNYDDKYTCKFKIIYRTCQNRMTHMNIIWEILKVLYYRVRSKIVPVVISKPSTDDIIDQAKVVIK